MSYYVTQGETEFHITEKNHYEVVKILAAEIAKETSDFFPVPHLPLIVGYFNYFNCEVRFDSNTGDIVGVHYECIGGGDKYFSAAMHPIAHLITPGSFVVFTGECGEIWRLFFNGEKMFEQSPVMVWPTVEGMKEAKIC
jgi:hypothetical protein